MYELSVRIDFVAVYLAECVCLVTKTRKLTEVLADNFEWI